MPNVTVYDKMPIRQVKTVSSYHPSSGVTMITTASTLNPNRTFRYRSKTWIRTPNYKALKASKAVLPDNTFQHYGYTLKFGGASFKKPTDFSSGQNRTWQSVSFVWSGPVAAVAIADSFTPDLNGLKFALIKKAKGNQWNAPVFVAEGRKTVDMVVQTASRLVHMGIALRRGSFRDFVELAHPTMQSRLNSPHLRAKFGRDYAREGQAAAAHYWLQLQYGWKPFMKDVRDAVNTLMDVVETPIYRVSKVNARFFEKSTQTTPEFAIFSDDAESIYVYGKSTSTITCTQKGVWRFTVNASDLPGRFGLTNPLEVAWELVPLSFVADWFLPIGDYLAALDVPMRFNHLGGVYGYKISLSGNTAVTRHQPAKGTHSGFGSSMESERVSRTPMAGAPDPSLSAMKFDANIGAARATSAIALLQTFFGNPKK